MNMTELAEKLPNCPCCGSHCPIGSLSCSQGRELAEKLLRGELSIEEAVRRKEEHAHGDHPHGEHHHGRHHHGGH